MAEWKKYGRTGYIEMRKHYPGEDMSKISVADCDKENVKHPGGMVARSQHNSKDMWYVNESHFKTRYNTKPLDETES